MNNQLASRLIEKREGLLYLTWQGGPYFLCYYPYDMTFTDTLRVIPSFTWRKPLSAWRVHYLDLPIMEAQAFTGGYTVKYEPEALSKLAVLKSGYLERRDIKKAEKFDVPCLRPLRNYQSVGSYFMYRSCELTGGVLNADAMGAGKTAQAIGAVILNKLNGKPYKTLVLCPTSVKSVWIKEIKIVSGMKAMSITGGMAKRLEQYETAHEYDFLICSYQTLLSDYEEIVEKFGPSILIFDECHRISNRTNKITQLMIGGKNKKKTLRDIAKLHSVYLLTGTPISNRLEDLYPMLKLMDPGILSWTGFKKRYAEIEVGERWDRKYDIATKKMKPFIRKFDTIVGYQNEKELKAKLSLHMIRRTKDEVLPELPPKIFQTLEIELSAEERKIYNALKREFKTTIRGMELTVENKLAWMTRAQQICDSLEIIPGSKAKKSSKLEELIRIVDENAKDRKIVIFSRFSTMTKIICRELKHLKPIHFHGGVPDDKRGALIDAFQEKPEHRVFVSTLGAGGVGISLTAADLCILYDRWWAPGGNFQAVDRLHRSGQENTVNVVILRVNNSVEEHVERTWLTKQGIVQDMVGDEKVIGALTKKEMSVLL